MITKSKLTAAVDDLSLMKFFPGDDGSRAALADQLAKMCGDDSRVFWLVGRVTDLYSEWPGIRELRAVLCSKFRPADGKEITSEVYPDGIPSETGRLENAPAQLAGSKVHKLLQEVAERLPLTEAEDELLKRTWDEIKARQEVAAAIKAKRIILPDIPVDKPLTRADIDEALAAKGNS